jgi:hypothetical protein
MMRTRFDTPPAVASGIMRGMTDPEIKPKSRKTIILAGAGAGAAALLALVVGGAWIASAPTAAPERAQERARCQTHADCAENCPATSWTLPPVEQYPFCQRFTHDTEGVCWCVPKGEAVELLPGNAGRRLPPPRWWTCTEWLHPKGQARAPDAGPFDGACTRGPVLVILKRPEEGSPQAQYYAHFEYDKWGPRPPGYDLINIFCHEGRDPGLDPNNPPPTPDGGLRCE